MDIKDFILIGGGLLIAAVVTHGFWIAWRERRQDLRIDIKPDLIPDDSDGDDIDRLRGELPNGGARLSRSIHLEDPQQDDLNLDPPPLLLEPTEGPPAEERRIEPALSAPTRSEPALPTQQNAQADKELPPIRTETPEGEGRPRVAEVSIPETESGPVAESKPHRKSDPIVPDQPRQPRRLAQRKSVERVAQRADASNASSASPAVEELIIMNVLASPGQPYRGDSLFTVMSNHGMKFGDMNIFHRIEPLSKMVSYSAANVVEPGTFDLSEMDTFTSPGLCMFMQLPGPDNPLETFEHMLGVARAVCGALGGEIKDEHLNVITPQTVAHYQQRIQDFSRRRMASVLSG